MDTQVFRLLDPVVALFRSMIDTFLDLALIVLVGIGCAIVFLAAAMLAIEARDARKAKRILGGRTRVSPRERRRIVGELGASDDERCRQLAHRLEDAEEHRAPQHLPL